MIDRNGLGYIGYAYTLSNKRVGKFNIKKHLDRGFANGDWKVLYPNVVVTHLTAPPLDHKPILINLSPPSSNRLRPFRFEAMWSRDPSAVMVVEKAWQKGHGHLTFSYLVSKLKTTKIALKDWNKKLFGHLQSGIQKLKNHIDLIQAQTVPFHLRWNKKHFLIWMSYSSGRDIMERESQSNVA